MTIRKMDRSNGTEKLHGLVEWCYSRILFLHSLHFCVQDICFHEIHVKHKFELLKKRKERKKKKTTSEFPQGKCLCIIFSLHYEFS